jgi:hypothetical protein
MVERRKFTAEFIDELLPPTKGERWISDADLPGFGIRLWGGRTQGMSYAIRVNIGGKIIRQSIEMANRYTLEYARSYAIRKIEQLKFKPSPNQMAKKIKAMTFEELADFALEGQIKAGRSGQYIDDNRSRYSFYTPKSLSHKHATEVTAQELRDILNCIQNKPAQRRNLRSFYSYMLNLADDHCRDGHFIRVAYQLKDEKVAVFRSRFFAFKPDTSLQETDFQKLFKILRSEKEYPQHADFISFMFSAGAPVNPSKLLKSKWDEIFIKKTNSQYLKVQKEYFVWQPKRRTEKSTRIRGQRLDGDILILLRKIKKRNDREFPGSPFLFPSKRAHKTEHMTSYKFYWEKIKISTGLPEMPLVDLVHNYSWRITWKHLN